MLAIYVHIPFCKQKCKYCDFNSYPGLDRFHRTYINALTSEIALQSSKLEGRSVGSIYIGGGTPTLLDPAHIGTIVSAINNYYSVAQDAEVSIEANPETVTLERMVAFKEAGINRLSIGFQSLDDEHLLVLGRKHSAERAVEAFRAARTAGFDNINIDLIFGVPNQSTAHWALTLEQVASLEPEHLSCYGLTVEPGTVLECEVASGLLEVPGEDTQAEMFMYTMESLQDSGFEHYEISNYAKPGRRCRHNLVYWNNDDYIGFGAGAHSKFEGVRFSNTTSPEAYISSVSSGLPVAETIDLSVQDKMSETLFLGLRIIEGIDLDEFEERFGEPIQAVYGPQINELVRDGLVVLDSRLRLTAKGILLGNEVFSRFI